MDEAASLEPRRRVVITGVYPEIESGRFPISRVVGEDVRVEADVFADGHDLIRSVLRYRRQGEDEWRETEMEDLVNDRWFGTFTVNGIGRWEYGIVAWIDRFGTWQHDLHKKAEAGVDVDIHLRTGAVLVDDFASVAEAHDGKRLRELAEILEDRDRLLDERVEIGEGEELALLMRRNDPRRHLTTYRETLAVRVDHQRARFSTWYELFPRSASDQPNTHGTLRDVIDNRLDHVSAMGFDVLYLPPIHPIGEKNRKGKNNATTAEADDVGSPWAIGSKHGGHKSVHPDLGTIDDVKDLVTACRERHIELALDIALQCAPDHPYVEEHPDWFNQRPDGSIQYAENPPKKYEDIVPFDFECEDWQNLWDELKSIFEFWIDVGVKTFRVDNPHTKSLRFWEWCIDELTREHPDLVFLSEAFTRPKLMQGLAKRGFTQSYTYFTWRQRKWEIEEYYTHLTQDEPVEYLRPNAWPNTPDILTEQLQHGGRPVYIQRLVLAATLCASYGMYGPAFELMWSDARPGAEEYLDNEKYQIRDFDLDASYSLKELIARVNRIRRNNSALQTDRSLHFHPTENEELICYSKRAGKNTVLVVVNLDPHWPQSGWIHLDLDVLGVSDPESFEVHDLLGDGRFRWHGPHNFVALDPNVLPAHVFRVSTDERTERDFETFQ